MKKCLIVDDESLARDLIKEYLRHFDGYTVIGECKTAIEAAQFLSKHQVDLLFLDINMPQMSGIELLKQVAQKPLTILCTALSEYALESYELDVIDYLLKPIGLARFTKAISKVEERKGSKGLAQSATNKKEATSFFVKSEYKKIKINPAEIRYIEAMEKYIRIHLKADKVMTLMSMSAVMKYLDEEKFLRIHRSFIIHKDAISSIEGNMVVIDGKKIPVSKANKNLIQKLFR